MDTDSLGQRIKAERMKRKWSQAKLAEMLGVSTLTVVRWENDAHIPREDARMFLVNELNIPVDMFEHESKDVPEKQEEISQPEPITRPSSHNDREEEPFIEYVVPPLLKVYEGWREPEGKFVNGSNTHVTVNGQPLHVFDPGHHFRNDSDPDKRTIFEWGYGGAGPRTLASSILADYFGEHEDQGKAWGEYKAVQYESAFKDDFVRWLSRKLRWKITAAEIAAWLIDYDERKHLYPEKEEEISFEVTHQVVERWIRQLEQGQIDLDEKFYL
jgi:transcriptional regulator with XRE-family HTH domain